MAPAPAPIEVGLVGYGYWGRHYLRLLAETDRARLTVVCDRDPARQAAARKRFPAAAVTGSLDALLETPGMRAVIVSTPASTHYEVARRCLDAGKHLLVEKPLTTRAAESQALADAAQSAGLTLLVGHTFLYNSAVLCLKELIDAGELGTLYCIYARRTNLGPIRDDVNALWDLAPHDVAVFNYLLGGQPQWVSAVGHQVLARRLEDVGFVSLFYPGNVLCHLHASWTDPHKVREIVVVGSRGRAVFNDLDLLEPLRIFYRGVHAAHPDGSPNSSDGHPGSGPALVVHDGDIRSPSLVLDEPLRAELTHFLDCVRDQRQPRTDGAFGAAVVSVLEAIDASVAACGAPKAVAPVGRAASPVVV